MTHKEREPARLLAFHFLESGLSGGRWARMFTSLLIFLIIANVLAVIIETVPTIGMEWRNAFHAFELFSLLVFTGEYLGRLWVAPEHLIYKQKSDLKARMHYATRPTALVDLAAIAPLVVMLGAGDVQDFLILRVFSLVRFLKLARYSPSISSLVNALAAERRALSGALIIMLGALIVFSTLEYLIERDVQPEKFGSIPDAMWWGIATLATVGYGDVTPITPLGKLVAGFAMLFGLGMFTIPFGIVATAFVREIQRREFVVTWTMVARVPLFGDLNASEIGAVTELLEAHLVEAGAYICRAGEEAHCMYFIVAGEVDVEMPGMHHVMGAGAFFGEIAVLSRARRTATARAITRTNLLTLQADDLHRLMERQPHIAQRIREISEERIKSHQIKRGGDITSDELANSSHLPPDKPS